MVGGWALAMRSLRGQPRSLVNTSLTVIPAARMRSMRNIARPRRRTSCLTDSTTPTVAMTFSPRSETKPSGFFSTETGSLGPGWRELDEPGEGRVRGVVKKGELAMNK